MVRQFFSVSTERAAAYADAEAMEDTIDEVSAALDILSDEAVNAEGGSEKSFNVTVDGDTPPEVVQAIDDVIARLKLHEKAYGIARDTLMYGDNFLQYVVNTSLLVTRLMYLPPQTMVRNETDDGLLKNGQTQHEWAYEQYMPGTNQFIAGFLPWQIQHLRWNRRGSQVYGRSLCYTARTSWRKLKAMEEALCVNWLTRAFARLLFEIDVTGKSDKEARLAIREFKQSLTTRNVASGVLGEEQLSVVKDIFIGRGYHDFAGKPFEGLTKASVLDTSSSGFSNLDPIEYYRGKIITSLRVPRAYLGLEKDINAKATLSFEDRRFARTIRRVQSLMSELVMQTISLQLILLGYTPSDYALGVEWPNPSRTDQTEQAQALNMNAKADQVLTELGVVDTEFIALNHVQMTPAQWKSVKERVSKEAAAKAAEDAKAQADALALAQAQGRGGPNPNANQNVSAGA